ncbi:hypothetical protein CONCODRAFT_70709 [Conidiobolus coronatus NRRL 28638]|uniref:Uncharacterized protein n=1 Tax=Conidiobolus coronatus (strain ATCC 28846 / CBS 209.66 / NRRL 28638) TaxID=796925 RepID=A0A137P5U3_CONC2|nr:hypothetical protein CONCODRAFT_70709 [Conidiobolus coronatus NRRL 28638]|eukprot:KXN70366.1 hypothetical protein CONCODRAFT_70709 [Conidiobolus coronatus NRRL 28638]
MKLIFVPLLITSTLCYKATINESNGKNKAIQGDFGVCINEKGSGVGVQAPKGVEVQFYRGEACKKHWFLRAWGKISFDKEYEYYSVKLASNEGNNGGGDMVQGSDSGYVVTNSE